MWIEQHNVVHDDDDDKEVSITAKLKKKEN